MGTQDFNVLFVIWRECIEALLVIGILNAWLGKRPVAERRSGRLWLWSGVVVGLVGAVALAFLLLTVGDALGDDSQEYFQTAIVLLAAALIVQMVFWMRRHGRTLKSELHASLSEVADRSNWFGVFALATLAVLREGSEAAVFLYGTMAGVSASNFGAAIAAVLGIVAALATYWLLQIGGKILSWRTFFRVTEVMLLFLAASLLLSGIDHLISLGLLPSLSGRLWDTSPLLPDSGMAGGVISGLTGYRARPVMIELLAFAAYWTLVIWLLNRPRAAQPA
ncbi:MULTISPECIES: FTR1 family iron permease [Phyllobacteriaceae]|mgnify:CR=1 FL=1|jgi:high-affinity iron transporter|uniref:FTR1 family iron permease n=1 Tax=Mesorhizobium hungaricum TaxID=1566387 RepID=A0A1C2EF16_9HYPH|nr:MULTISPECIES: FTR1 family protein [Mesorhizobium]MBN9236163.1 FTR1 family iron permease [Mesorhizobium sp.]MDQ0328145.1 high-affinity iron transporter [Mesorhizobium sp. YL-MeA3-2017]OCX25575.1 FTR1 family iron permease [Mesorhizobium hungaricum]